MEEVRLEPLRKAVDALSMTDENTANDVLIKAEHFPGDAIKLLERLEARA